MGGKSELLSRPQSGKSDLCFRDRTYRSGGVFAPGDAYAQTKYCLSIIQKALQDLGADCSDVVQVRLFVTDISRAQEFIQAHREFFAEHPPTNTMVEVSALVDPAMLVEVEAEAICFSHEVG